MSMDELEMPVLPPPIVKSLKGVAQRRVPPFRLLTISAPLGRFSVR